MGTNGLPVFLGERVKGQTGLQIPRQTRNGSRRDGLILLDESCHGLISRVPILLIAQGFQLWSELLVLLAWDEASHLVPFMHHTALTSRIRKCLGDRVEHGLVAITHPEVNR